MKKLAVLGLNHGYEFAKRIVTKSGVELVAVAGNNKDARERALQLQVPLFEDYKQLLERCELDAAIITLPNDLHLEATEYCAKKGIDILLEKPIASTEEEAQQIIQLKNDYDIQLLVGHHRRFSNKIIQLRNLITAGKLGEIVGMHMMFTIAKDEEYFNESWRISEKGGPLLNNAIHDIDNLRYVTQAKVSRVYATASNMIRGNIAEDVATILLETQEGPQITYFVSDGIPAPWSYELTVGENPLYAQESNDCYFVFGTKGSVSFPSFTYYHYDDEQGHYGWYDPLVKKQLEVQSNDPITDELEHFYDVINRKVSPRVTAEDALETLKVVLAIKKSVIEKTVIELN